MKKFFKILRKIIKILLKSILRLILGIIVITGIVLIIINNRTLKLYEDYDGTIGGFTMKESFIVENGCEFKLNLKEKKVYFNCNYYDNKEKGLFNIKIPNISTIKKFLETNNKSNIIFSFVDNGYSETYYKNNQIENKHTYNDFRRTEYGYYYNGNIKEEQTEDIFGNINITGYYENGNLKNTVIYNGNIGIETGYYENGNLKYIENTKKIEEGYYIHTVLNGEHILYYNNGQIEGIGNLKNGLGTYTYYDDLGNFIGTGEILCSNELINGYCKKEIKNGITIEYLHQRFPEDNFQIKIPEDSIKSKGVYFNGQKEGHRTQYYENGDIYSEGDYNNGKKVGIWNRFLGDGSIGVSKDYGGIEEVNNE